MAEAFESLDEALEALEGMSMRTSQGSYVKMEDVKKVLKKKAEATALEKEQKEEHPDPKTMNEAKQAIKRNPDLMASMRAGRPRELGRSIAASDPHPPSRA